MPTLGGALRATARRVPDAEALSFEGNEYTYAELDQAVDRAAEVLAARGIVKGDRFALMATNSDRFVIAFYAAHRLGAVFVPVNPASAPPEIDYLLADSGAKVFVYDSRTSAAVQTAIANGLPDSTEIIMSLGPSDDHDDLLALAAVAEEDPPPDTVTEIDDAMILYTSGTTGKPKGALFDHHRSMWVGVNCIATCGMRVGDRFLHVAPLYHAAELCIMLAPGVMLGAKHVVLPSFDPAQVVEVMEAERITMFFGVPTMYQFMLKVPGIAARDLSAWRTGLFGAAPMPPSIVSELTDTLPHVAFVQLCGQTEGGPGGIYCSAEQVRARPDASGKQGMPFTEFRVVDADGSDVAPGGTGELLLRGETIMKEYWNKPTETAETIVDGWLHTGDLARFDEDGYVTLVDRMKDMIITGGRNVYSVEVESVLIAHPAVADCAIIARKNEQYGESIVAVVTLNDGATLTLDAVRAFCREHVSDYKVPHDLVVRDTIPRNPSGKILKHELRADIEAVS